MTVRSALEAPVPPPTAEAESLDAAGVEAASALAGAAEALSSGMALSPLLGAVAAAARRAFGADRCLIYLRDVTTGDLVGAVAHDERSTNRDLEWIASQRLPADTPGISSVLDGEIAELELPPSVDDLESRLRRSPASLAVAIPVSDEAEGLMVLARSCVWGLVTADRVSYLRAFASLAGAGIANARRVEAVDSQRRVIATRLREERRIASGAERLVNATLDRDAPTELLARLAAELGLCCAVIDESSGEVLARDADGRSLGFAWLLDINGGARHAFAAELADIAPGESRVVGPFPECGVPQRSLLTALPAVAGQAALIVIESGRELTRADLRLARQAAALLGVQLRVRREAADRSSVERAAIVRDAIYASCDHAALRARASLAGIDLDATSVVCVISPVAEQSDGGSARLAGRIAGDIARLSLKRLDLLASTSRGVVVIAPLDPERPRRAAVASVRSEVGQLLTQWSDGPAPIATVSSPCRRTEELPRAFRECEELRRSVGSLGVETGASQILCADEIGAGRLLIGALSGPAAERFVADFLGSIPDQEERGRLLETLEAFFRENHFVRGTATSLGVHENTIRYRLRKFAELTGLDVLGNGDDQLTARLALAVLRLRSNVTIEKEYS